MPCIITVAITGSGARQEGRAPAVPVTVEEQVESGSRSLRGWRVHHPLHVRDEKRGRLLRRLVVRKGARGDPRACPDAIIRQFSTGGRGAALDERGGMLGLKPDMASLTTGSVNLANMLYPEPAGTSCAAWRER